MVYKDCLDLLVHLEKEVCQEKMVRMENLELLVPEVHLVWMDKLE